MAPETIREHVARAKAEAITLAWAAQGDANIEQAASFLLQAVHCLNRAARSAESAPKVQAS